MPLCSLHLVQLAQTSSSSASADEPFANRRRFLHRLLSSSDLDARLMIACVVRRPVITATRIDHVTLNKTAWDLLLVFHGEGSADAAASSSSSKAHTIRLAAHSSTNALVAQEYVVNIGIPTRIVEAYASRTQALNEEAQRAEPISMHDVASSPARAVSKFAPKTSQLLEYSPDLGELVDDLHALGTLDGLCDGRGPVQQLNLLAFQQSSKDKERYYNYGKAFGDAAKPFGGEPKVLGRVVGGNDEEQTTKWQEVSLVNYYSIDHFAAMAASETYQNINRAYRLPSLDDTTIICTQEVDLYALRSRIAIPQQTANL